MVSGYSSWIYRKLLYHIPKETIINFMIGFAFVVKMNLMEIGMVEYMILKTLRNTS